MAVGQPSCERIGEFKLLTEAEVERSFRRLFREQPSVDTDLLEKAESLLDELRPESPLRHRLYTELDEIREHGKS